jgi:hypothetical protein
MSWPGVFGGAAGTPNQSLAFNKFVRTMGRLVKPFSQGLQAKAFEQQLRDGCDQRVISCYEDVHIV